MRYPVNAVWAWAFDLNSYSTFYLGISKHISIPNAVFFAKVAVNLCKILKNGAFLPCIRKKFDPSVILLYVLKWRQHFYRF